METIKLFLQKLWYQKYLNPLLWPFIPLSLIYQCIITIRKILYEKKIFKVHHFSLPIIVVGNLTTGGTGKTPLVIHIARILKQQGLRPGIVSRGYLGNHEKPTFVYANSDPNQVGDEPLLLAKRLFCPIVVAKSRVAAVTALIDSGQVDIIISDDGLQHEAMTRDVEVIVIDGRRRFGNGWHLPIGPLRESTNRLKTVDFVVSNTPDRFDIDTEYEMELRPRPLYKAIRPADQMSINALQHKTVHAIAGIGYPERFFDLLKSYEINVISHPFPDHYSFKAADLNFNDEHLVIMTEKDAVKCEGMIGEKHWVLPVEASLNPLFDVRLLTMIQELRSG